MARAVHVERVKKIFMSRINSAVFPVQAKKRQAVGESNKTYRVSDGNGVADLNTTVST